MSETVHSFCQSESLLPGVALLQEKWTLIIVAMLMSGPCGFNELSRKATGVSATTLSQRLNVLEEAGIVIKTVRSTMPPRTSYELTEMGVALLPVLLSIESWSEKYIPRHIACPLAAEFEKGSE